MIFAIRLSLDDAIAMPSRPRKAYSGVGRGAPVCAAAGDPRAGPAGVAVGVDSGTVTADELRGALLQLTSPEDLAAQCAGIRRELPVEGGVGCAVELIEPAAQP